MEKKLHIKEGHRRTALFLKDIVYMEKYKSKIIVYTMQRQHCIYRSFSSLEPGLDGRFTRPHESYIINMDFIERIEEQEVVLQNGTRLRFGVKCARKAKKAFDSYAAENNSGFIR